MDLPVEPTMSDIGSARQRIDNYLTLLGIRDAAARRQLTLQILEEGARQGRDPSHRSLIDLAITEVDHALAAWLPGLSPSAAPRNHGSAGSTTGLRNALLTAAAPHQAAAASDAPAW